MVSKLERWASYSKAQRIIKLCSEDDFCLISDLIHEIQMIFVITHADAYELFLSERQFIEAHPEIKFAKNEDHLDYENMKMLSVDELFSEITLDQTVWNYGPAFYYITSDTVLNAPERPAER